MMPSASYVTLYATVPSSKPQPGIILQERDYALLCGLYESRIMTRQHMAALYFKDKPEATKKRVQKLLAAKLITEKNRHPNEPAILFLARGGFNVISDAGMLIDYPLRDWRSFQKRVQVSEATIRHELEVMSIKAAFTKAIRVRPGLTLAEFSTWPKLYEFRAARPATRDGWTCDRKVLMKPDGFIRIHEQEPDGGLSEHVFFLELDRGTENIQTVVSKAIGYREYYRSGGFSERCGLRAEEYRQCPFRVLLVCESEARMRNIESKLINLKNPIISQLLIARGNKIIKCPLGILKASSSLR